jgi:phosphatidylserine/phosphatidylglycerophosphate/cardiolipin synthase-like enzyme
MSSLVDVSTTSLRRLYNAIVDEEFLPPLSRPDLIAFGVKEQLDALVDALEGHSRAACLSILDNVLSERAKSERPAPELVWTGPEGSRAAARDTAVVLRELFEGAEERVILAGYSFKNATDVLSPLHATMLKRNIKTHFFVDIPQAETAPVDPDAYGQAALKSFLTENWPFGAPFPNLYCDKRALKPGPPWCSLHAKCVAVDGKRAFVSSANFTTRGQDRNIEAGVLLHDETFARQLERQWLSLIEGGLVMGD